MRRADLPRADLPGADLSRAARTSLIARPRLARCVPAVAGLLLAGLLVAAPAEVDAAPDCSAWQRGAQAAAGWLVPTGRRAWLSRELPDRGDAALARRLLDSDDSVLVQEILLAEDGRPDLLVASSNPRTCGLAGCAYVLLEADSQRLIGDFFGHLAVLDVRITRFRLLQTFSRIRGVITVLTTHVFDGNRYQPVGSVLVEACGLAEWSGRLREAGGGGR